jgi:hypothetical protein
MATRPHARPLYHIRRGGVGFVAGFLVLAEAEPAVHRAAHVEQENHPVLVHLLQQSLVKLADPGVGVPVCPVPRQKAGTGRPRCRTPASGGWCAWTAAPGRCRSPPACRPGRHPGYGCWPIFQLFGLLMDVNALPGRTTSIIAMSIKWGSSIPLTAIFSGAVSRCPAVRATRKKIPRGPRRARRRRAIGPTLVVPSPV